MRYLIALMTVQAKIKPERKQYNLYKEIQNNSFLRHCTIGTRCLFYLSAFPNKRLMLEIPGNQNQKAFFTQSVADGMPANEDEPIHLRLRKSPFFKLLNIDDGASLLIMKVGLSMTSPVLNLI